MSPNSIASWRNRRRAAKPRRRKRSSPSKARTRESLKPTKFYGFDELQTVALVVANEDGNTRRHAKLRSTPRWAGRSAIRAKSRSTARIVRSSTRSSRPSGKVYFHQLAQAGRRSKLGDRSHAARRRTPPRADRGAPLRHAIMQLGAAQSARQHHHAKRFLRRPGPAALRFLPRRGA